MAYRRAVLQLQTVAILYDGKAIGIVPARQATGSVGWLDNHIELISREAVYSTGSCQDRPCISIFRGFELVDLAIRSIGQETPDVDVIFICRC